MSLEITPSPGFVPSPFGRKERQAMDAGPDGNDITLAPGLSIPDYVRSVYGINKVDSFIGQFNFLDRDNKTRHYIPQDEDPFVAKSPKFIQEFKESANKSIDEIKKHWQELSLPIARDKDRGVVLPDVDAVINAILKNPKNVTKEEKHLIDSYMKHSGPISEMASEIDIMKKACLVRTVLPGWWIVSYKGKETPHASSFDKAIAILVDAMHEVRNSSMFKNKLEETLHEQGDPLDTNTGYPFFSAATSATGEPIAKLATVDLYRNVGTRGFSWPGVREEIDKRCPSANLKGHPFAIFSIRRQQPGYKWNHVWAPRMGGLKLLNDVRGYTTNRVAYGAPYILNLYLSAIQSEWKAIRKLIPGLYHDGAAKKTVLDQIRNDKPFIIESDYSNYDRNIPVNIADRFFAQYCSKLPHGNYYFDLLRQTNSSLPLIWPDWVGHDRGRGWIFNVDRLALLSGLKITSDIGTFINAIVIIKSILDSKVMTDTEIKTYLLSRVKGNESRSLFLIQSDDTLLLHKDFTKLRSLANSFVKAADTAGIKGALGLGDRFLMRHMRDGADTPMISRIWQNTLSNEASYQDPLKFTVGLCARTDGLFGHKTVDPFGTGKNQSVTKFHINYGVDILQELLRFTSNSKSPVRPAIEFITMLLTAGKRMQSQGNTKMATVDMQLIDAYRTRMVKALAIQELAKADTSLQAFFSTYVYSLYKNANSPTSKQILDEIIKLEASTAGKLNMIQQKENQFYKHALRVLNINEIIE